MQHRDGPSELCRRKDTLGLLVGTRCDHTVGRAGCAIQQLGPRRHWTQTKKMLMRPGRPLGRVAHLGC